MKKKLVFFIVFILLILCLTLSSEAISLEEDLTTPTWNYSCSRGVRNIYFFIDWGTQNDYYNYIISALDNWENTNIEPNPIVVHESQTSNGTAIDFYDRESFFWKDPDVLGETYHMNSSGVRIDPDYSNWLYSEIYFNTTNLNEESDTKKQGTLAHEIGHAWGLKHNTKTRYSIMCQTSSYRAVETVQKVDNDALIGKYGSY